MIFMKILLHICCAPCSIMSIKKLREEKHELTGFWYNPNIHPYMEYRARRDAFRNYSKSIDLPVIYKDEYGLDAFCKKVIDSLNNRCKICYANRLAVADVDSEGIRLGVWLNALRSSKKGKNFRAELTAEQIARLDALGMHWEGKQDTAWEKAYFEACQYRKKYGDLNVPSSYVTENGVRLGRWIRSQREVYKTTLSDARKQKLDLLGMVWEPEDPWNTKFRLVQQYYETNGHTQIPWDYVVNGVWLNKWLSSQTARLNEQPATKSRPAKKLTQEQKSMLASVGILPKRKIV